MAIRIKDNQVYDNDDLVGTHRKWCCGVDFHPLGKPNALFSVLVKKRNPNSWDFKRSVKAILSINIPDKPFHWNFNPETAKDKTKLVEYKTKLENL